MTGVQRIGGAAALIEAIAYIIGFGLFGFVLDSSGYVGPSRQVPFLIDNQATLTLSILMIYIVFGIALVILSIALHQRTQLAAPMLAHVATAFGLIWAGMVIASGMIFNIGMEAVIALQPADPAQAATVWEAVGAVHEGIGGGIELVGGLWVLLISRAAMLAGNLPKALNIIGILVGIAGVLTVIPGLDVLTDVFGLSQIVWFVWLGIVMLRTTTAAQ